MPYCQNCGAQVPDTASFCSECGSKIQRSNTGYTQANTQDNGYYTYNAYDGSYTPTQRVVPEMRPVRPKDDTMATVIKIFMIIGCVSIGWMLIPLAWCIPMTVSVFRSLDSGVPISTGMKVCTLLFVNLVAGICMLCADDV